MAAPLYPLFGDADVDRSMSDASRVQAMLDFEAALAEAAADIDLVPAGAAATIRHAARLEAFDLAALADEAAEAGNLAIPLVRALTARGGC